MSEPRMFAPDQDAVRIELWNQRDFYRPLEFDSRIVHQAQMIANTMATRQKAVHTAVVAELTMKNAQQAAATNSASFHDAACEYVIALRSHGRAMNKVFDADARLPKMIQSLTESVKEL